MTNIPESTRPTRPRLGLPAIVCACLLLFPLSLHADDPTFRELPGEETPSPADLSRLLMQIRLQGEQFGSQGGMLEELAEAMQRADAGSSQGGDVDLEELERNLPPSVRRMLSQAREQNGNRRGGRRPEEGMGGGSGSSRRSGGSGMREFGAGNGERPPSDPPHFRNRGAGDSSQDDADESKGLSGFWERLAPALGGKDETDADASESWRRRHRSSSRSRSRRESGDSDEESTPTKIELGKDMNRIVMEAVRRAEERRRNAAGDGAGESDLSFLSPLTSGVQQWLAESGNRERVLSALNRESEPSRRGNAGDGFNWRQALPHSLPSGEGAGFGGPVAFGPTMWLLGLAALAAGAAAALWKWGWPLRGESSRPRRPFHIGAAPVESREDFVGLMDSFLVSAFGRAATWWHCRAVARQLASLCPQMQPQAAQLAIAYERARYGPPSLSLSKAELDDAVQSLRRIAAEVQNDAGECEPDDQRGDGRAT